MYTQGELDALAKFAYSSPPYELEDFLSDKEIEVIREGGSRAETLLNRIFIPKTNSPVKTIRMQHLFVDDFNLTEWLLGMADCLRYHSLLTVNIGFSYMVVKSPEREMRYVYAAKALAYDRCKLNFKGQFVDFAESFKKHSDSDFLMETFMSQLRGNVFESSGFYPYRLVCAYCWLTK